MKKDKSTKATFLLCLLIIFIVATLEGCWFFLKKYFDGVSLDSIIFTIHTMTVSTIEFRMVKGFLFELLYTYSTAALILFFLFSPFKISFRGIQLLPVRRRYVPPFLLFLVLGCVVHISVNLEVGEYIHNKHSKTYVYDNYYVPPENVHLTFPKEKRNLIVIYMESMESTYLPKNLGGGEIGNLIPYLGDLAYKNINFSQSDKIGGPEYLRGTDWTVAGIFGSQTGIPLSIPIYDNCYSGLGTFAPGAYALGDILRDKGYNLTFIMGSDATFGGRKNFLELHGGFKILDYDVAISDGIIPQGYHVWWGYEDKYLYLYAQKTLLKLQKGNNPFCFMLLTADTHHIGGYVCSECEDSSPVQFENVIMCADRQVAKFIDWLKTQDFYKDTTVVILGDHCSMDPNYFKDLEESGYVRHPYNVFINSVINDTSRTKNRTFTTLDYYPTILAAMGVRIDGERLGLGTNLFSARPTLPEEYGIDALRSELLKTSDYYYNKILYGEAK